MSERFATPEAEQWIGRKIPCLDRGFVYLVDYMGGDASIVQAARVSYGLGTKSVSEDRGLIRYLMRHQHTTPFEMVELKFHVKMPIFVARQWIRHRTACLSGASELVFDRPGGDERGRRQGRIPIAEFHRLWHRGATHALAAGMRLRMCDESTGEIRHTHVADVWESGVKRVFRITLDNGYRLTMTADHRCLTENGWMTLGNATGLRMGLDGAISWNDGAPALAVNGQLAFADQPELTQRPSAVRRLVRTFSRIRKIEPAGSEMTYDLAVTGPYHNFVANGFIVHNSVNEYSGRYSVMPDEFYTPDVEHVTSQSETNRQGGADTLSRAQAEEVLRILTAEQRQVRAGYDRMIELDVRRELARINLGVSQYTEWYWKNDLHNIFHFLQLRLDAHAQYEIRVYAEAMAQIVRAVAPIAWEAFEDYQLSAERLSRLELETLARLLAGGAGWPGTAAVEAAFPPEWRERNAKGELKRSRERDEFLAKLARLAERRSR